MTRSPVCLVQLLPCALLLLNLLCASIAHVTISDIAGNYTMVRGILNICADTAEISSTASTLAAQTLAARSLSFDGKICSTGSFPLTERRGSKTWGDLINEKVGIQVAGISRELRCQEHRLSNVSVFFMRSIADVKLRGTGFKDYYNRRKGVKYFYIADSEGSCLYHEASTDPSPSPSPSPTSTVSKPNNGAGVMDANGKETLATSKSNISLVDPAVKEKKNGSDQSIWVWLGPLIGAGATIIAAIITVIHWPRRSVEEDAQRLGVQDDDHEY